MKKKNEFKYQVMSKKKKGEWQYEEKYQRLYSAVMRARMFKKMGRKAKVINLPSKRTKYYNFEINWVQFVRS